MNDATRDARESGTQSTLGARFDTILLGALIVAMCSQLNIGDIGRDTTAEGYVTKQLKIAVPDIVLLGCFVWFVARTWAMRAWKRLWWPPLPCWALIFAMILSALHSQTITTAVAESMANASGIKNIVRALITKESKEAIAETIQFGLYFCVAPWLFVNLVHDNRDAKYFASRRDFALKVFAVAVGVVILIAFLQHLTQRTPQALFGSPNVYSGFLAMSLPLLILFLSRGMSRQMPWVLAILIAGTMLVLSSLWAALALTLGLGAAMLLSRAPHKARIGAVALTVLILTAAFWSFQPRPERAESLRISSATQKVKKQYIEWQVALGWSNPKERAFTTGVGPGNYQLNIGPYYQIGSLPNEEKMPPDSNNLYLVQVVSIGALGLGALLWTIGHFAHLAWRARKMAPDDWLGAGVLASLAAWAFVNIFHALIVRGAGIVLAFVLSLAVIAWRDAIEESKANATELVASEGVETDSEELKEL